MRFGMRSMVKWALICQGGLTFLFLLAMWFQALPATWLFPVGFVWFTSVFYLAGFGIGNLSSIAMEPVGHMAGLAASIITATATVMSIMIAAPIGQAFNGTLIPLTLGIFVLGMGALVLVLKIDETEV